jgi:hypothetical protein
MWTFSARWSVLLERNPIRELTPCYGLGGCPHHSTCAAYHAVEARPYANRIMTCKTLDGRFPAGEATAAVCTYPACSCPHDAPADSAWCARGLRAKV